MIGIILMSFLIKKYIEAGTATIIDTAKAGMIQLIPSSSALSTSHVKESIDSGKS